MLITFRAWRPLAVFNLILGLAVVAYAVRGLGEVPTTAKVAAFALAMLAAVVTLYAVLLAFTALVFWSPGLMLTWVVPVGVITTVPTEALTGRLAPGHAGGQRGALPGAARRRLAVLSHRPAALCQRLPPSRLPDAVLLR